MDEKPDEKPEICDIQFAMSSYEWHENLKELEIKSRLANFGSNKFEWIKNKMAEFIKENDNLFEE